MYVSTYYCRCCFSCFISKGEESRGGGGRYLCIHTYTHTHIEAGRYNYIHYLRAKLQYSNGFTGREVLLGKGSLFGPVVFYSSQRKIIKIKTIIIGREGGGGGGESSMPK